MIAFVLCLLGALFALPAGGDVVWSDPNDFYEQHKYECVEAKQTYDVPPDVRISLKTEPGSETEVAFWESYQEFYQNYGLYVLCTYKHQGEIWGFVDVRSHSGSFSGWVLLDGAAIAYTPDDFYREYEHLFYAYSKDRQAVVNRLEELGAQNIVFWRWPCSGRIEFSSADWGGLSRSLTSDDLGHLPNYRFARTFKDTLGREWVYFACDAQHGWICLDDPENASIPATISNYQPWLWDPGDYPPEENTGISSTVLIAALVGFVVAGSALLILIINRPKKT